MSAGKRKPSESLSDYDAGLFDLGDVSSDLAALGSDVQNDICGELQLDVDGESAAECDYDSVSSPGGSTCSGPTYVRHAGFGPETATGRPTSSDGPSPVQRELPANTPAQANQLLAKGLGSRHLTPGTTASQDQGKDVKKQKKGLLRPQLNDAGQEIRGMKHTLGTSTSTRNKNKKEPLPMKLRALPQSFWQQPNQANPLPPGSVYSTLPPLPGQDHVPTVSHVAGEAAETLLKERSTSAANTDLLFSLFNSVDSDLDKKKKIQLVRRGRPKKATPLKRPGMLVDEDPCLVSNMTESILPLIPDRAGGKQQHQGTQVIKIMSISHGDRSVDLPSLNVDHNYPQLLSELVLKL